MHNIPATHDLYLTDLFKCHLRYFLLYDAYRGMGYCNNDIWTMEITVTPPGQFNKFLDWMLKHGIYDMKALVPIVTGLRLGFNTPQLQALADRVYPDSEMQRPDAVLYYETYLVPSIQWQNLSMFCYFFNRIYSQYFPKPGASNPYLNTNVSKIFHRALFHRNTQVVTWFRAQPWAEFYQPSIGQYSMLSNYGCSEFIVFLMKTYPWSVKARLVNLFAANDILPGLKYLASRGVRPNHRTLWVAMRNGRKKVSEWLLANGCRVTKTLVGQIKRQILIDCRNEVRVVYPWFISRISEGSMS